MKKLMVGCVLGLLNVSVLFGASHLIHFQGRLTDNDGVPITGTPQITFRLFNAAVGGVAVWQSPQPKTVTSNDAGLFATDIGPLSVELFKTNNNLHLEVAVHGVAGPEVLAPRQKLNFVPYAFSSDHALHALQADTVVPDGIDSLHIKDGAVSSADVAPEAITTLHLKDGTVSPTDISNNAVRSSHILDGTIQAVDLSSSAFQIENIPDRSIEGVKLKLGTVTTNEITDGTIGTADVAVSGITEINLSNESVSSQKIKNGSVLTEDLGVQAVDTANLSLAVAGRLIPAGLIALFAGVCPSGWERFSVLDGHFPMGGPVYTGNKIGGWTLSGLSVGEAGQHSHQVNAHAHSHGTLHIGGFTPVTGTSARLQPGGVDITMRGDTGSAAPGTNSTGNHNHILTSDGSWRPPHVVINYCKKL